MQLTIERVGKVYKGGAVALSDFSLELGPGVLGLLVVIALIINVAIVIYLLFAKRLFGLRGGGAAEEALRERDVGIEALLRTTP